MLETKRDSEKTKNRILDVSFKIFAKKGYDAATTREICEGAKVNINLIYYYFGGKKELYNALIARIFNKQTEFISKYFDLSTDFSKLTNPQKFEFLHRFSDVIIDFLYKSISKEKIAFFLHVQQSKEGFVEPPPAYKFLLGLLMSIFDDMSKEEVIFELLFFMSQIVFPKLVPSFSLKSLGRSDFLEKDVNLIRLHIHQYIEAMIVAKAG